MGATLSPARDDDGGILSTIASVTNEIGVEEVIRQVPSEDPNRAGQLTFEDPDITDAADGAGDEVGNASSKETKLRKARKEMDEAQTPHYGKEIYKTAGGGGAAKGIH
eukprot:CAMPEP_0181127298 /NCGR_PEP_ID=MMETSP1071-20121207/28120_1 /TAXON_ID=35127 /ORGANISM="Thalassiosira sp., Strain NH16" /LENGTH=107 /DNA_ID=CAMNT_0023213021 /DNA_START=134 /DNA_END=457 /DNA_ORIENTATION=-